jgi:hypothetical protein
MQFSAFRAGSDQGAGLFASMILVAARPTRAEASLVEHRGLAELLPYLEERAYRGRLVSTAKGPLSRTLQKSFGDFFMSTDAETVRSLEIKVERHWTGNLFLETWSNRNLDDREQHNEHGSTPGWLVTSRADLLLFYFLDSDDLVTVPLLRLKRWAFGSGPQDGIYAWPERPPGRYGQRNDTWGRCVPVEHLERVVGALRTQVRQLGLLPAGGLVN